MPERMRQELRGPNLAGASGPESGRSFGARIWQNSGPNEVGFEMFRKLNVGSWCVFGTCCGNPAWRTPLGTLALIALRLDALGNLALLGNCALGTWFWALRLENLALVTFSFEIFRNMPSKA